MPIIASHHHNDPWRPLLEWPEDCSVQWGGRGVVLSRKGSYRTAFFEVFPKDGSGGFIRGEGETVEGAEACAHARWQRQKQCFEAGGHFWGRARRLAGGKTHTYTNGGAWCIRCCAFQTALRPIVTLGAWREPLRISELHLIEMGSIWPVSSAPGDVKFARRLWLRAKRAGLRLPHYTEPRFQTGDPEDSDRYGEACHREVVRHYAEQVSQQSVSAAAPGTMQGMFDGLTLSALHAAALRDGLLPEGTPLPA